MKACMKDDMFDWIRAGREQHSELNYRDARWPGVKVTHLMPDSFDAYVKILHRIEGNYVNIDTPLSPEELNILEIPDCLSLRKVVLSNRFNEDAPRLRWKLFADALGLPFEAGITDAWFRTRLDAGCWPRFVNGPDESYLEPAEYSVLASILASESISDSCFYRLAEIPFVATDQSLLFEGTLQEVTSIPIPSTWNSPEYWWSADREWCVCSDYDLSFTVVGGTNRLISKILANSMIETVEVFPSTRVDDFSPIPSPGS